MLDGIWENPSRVQIKTPNSDSAALYLLSPWLADRLQRFLVITVSPCSLLKYQCSATPVCQFENPPTKIITDTYNRSGCRFHDLQTYACHLRADNRTCSPPNLRFSGDRKVSHSASIHLALLSLAFYG